METGCSFALECLDTGLTREVEAHLVATLKYTLPLCVPHRFTQPAALLLYEKSALVALEQSQFRGYVALIDALFTVRLSISAVCVNQRVYSSLGAAPRTRRLRR